MRGSNTLPFRCRVLSSIKNIIQIHHGSFYRQHPSAGKDSAISSPLFPNLDFSLPAFPLRRDASNEQEQQHWAVISATGGTTFLEILRGSHICIAPLARTFPYLSSEDIEAKDHRLRSPSAAIQYVGFTNSKGQGLGGGLQGSYLSARYESRREETDWSVLQYLKGETVLNASQELLATDATFSALLSRVIQDLRLERLTSMPVSNLSNGQTRRARIAKALLGRPEVLLLDEPFSRSLVLWRWPELMATQWVWILPLLSRFLLYYGSWHISLLLASSCHYGHKTPFQIGSRTSSFWGPITVLRWPDQRPKCSLQSIDGAMPFIATRVGLLPRWQQR